MSAAGWEWIHLANHRVRSAAVVVVPEFDQQFACVAERTVNDHVGFLNQPSKLERLRPVCAQDVVLLDVSVENCG